jgi:anti-anti-sigma factor
MPDGRVTHLIKDSRHVLRYFGRVNYTMAPAIERFASGLLEQIEPGELVFDLRAAEMLDSTNLGLMARLANVRESDRPSRIISTNDDITDVIRSMGFERTFEIITEERSDGASSDEVPIAVDAPSRGDLLRTMLEAHRVLAAMDDQARFDAVVECLESELQGGGTSGR